MMGTIVVCCKWALDISSLPSGFPEKAYPQDWEKKKISEFDLQALREGVRIRSETGWPLIAVTCGAGVSSALRDILSRGPDSISYVDDPLLASADPRTTAKVLAAMIKELPDVKVVICGEGSSDRGSQQIGPRLAVLLGYGCLTYVSALIVTAEGFKVERSLLGEKEVFEAVSPLVLSVSGGLTKPDLPGVKAIMESGRKPTTSYTLEELGLFRKALEAEKLGVELVSYSHQRKGIRLDSGSGNHNETARLLLEVLSREGLLERGGTEHDLGSS